jgi:aminoglycoside N3'-acetyltransferase
VLVHAATIRTRWLVGGGYGDQARNLARHIGAVTEMAAGRPVWHAAFNEDFRTTGRFDPTTDPSQVGDLSEAFRTGVAEWRTAVPVFSVAGIGEEPELTGRLPKVVDPFGAKGAFGQLVARNGSILWYGQTMRSSPLLQYAEARAGGPVYRYLKDFAGTVGPDGADRPVVLRQHVRPAGRGLEYDWDRIEGEAVCAGIMQPVAGTSGACWWAPAAELAAYWTETIRRDPLAFLEPYTREWVATLLDKLGRGFELADFEGPEGEQAGPEAG